MSVLSRLQGLLCVLLLPLHTVIFALAGIVAGVVQPRGHGVMAVARIWSWVILATGWVQVRGHHSERIPPGACVIVANHQSFFDIPALMVVLPTRFRMVAKSELFRIPIFGWALSLGGFIPVDRARRDRAIASLSRAGNALRQGTTIVMFAEGTRSTDGLLQPFKKGPFRLAQEARVPLLPVTISGSRAILPRNRWLPLPGLIDIVVGEPTEPTPPGKPVERRLRATAEAVERGYTERHRADLDAGFQTDDDTY